MTEGPTFRPSSGQQTDLLTNRPMGRAVKYYPIYESELDAIGALTFQLEAFVAAFGFFLSAGLTLYLENQLSPEASPQGELLLAAGPWICGILSVICAAVGIQAYLKRRGSIQKIKKEAVEIFPD